MKRIKEESTTPPPEASPQSPSPSLSLSKSWSEMAGVNMKKFATEKSPQKRKPTKINPEFELESTGYDRIIIVSTHFNNKPFKDYIADEKAIIINMAISLDKLDNLHRTSFHRSEEDVLYIVYKLKQNMSIHEIYKSIHQFFWFDKTSKDVRLDKISGWVVYPPMEEKNIEKNDKASTHYKIGLL